MFTCYRCAAVACTWWHLGAGKQHIAACQRAKAAFLPLLHTHTHTHTPTPVVRTCGANLDAMAPVARSAWTSRVINSSRDGEEEEGAEAEVAGLVVACLAGG